VRTVEGGVGVFLVNLNTLERKQIVLAKAADRDRNGAVKLFGWSPDDRYLAFSTLQGGQNRNISIYDGTTGAAINSFESPRPVETGKWLATDSLVMIDNTHLLFLLNLETDSRLGQYGNKGFVKLQQLDRSGSWPTPDSSRSAVSVAYLDKGNVWSFDLSADKLTQLTHLTNAVISSLDYNGDTFNYLFDVKTGNSQNQILYQYALSSSTFTPLSPTNFSAKGQWIQNGAGIAYVGTKVGAHGNRNFLVVTSKDPAFSTNLFTAPPLGHYAMLQNKLFIEGEQVLRTFSVNSKGNKIYAVAALNYQPLAIWEYDIAAQTLRDVVPDKEYMVSSQSIVPVQGSIDNSTGERVDYYYLPPAGLEKNKKYPAVLDVFTDLGYQPNSQFLANAGIFYFTATPFGTGEANAPTNPEDALAVYKEMLKNPNIDPKRIYVFGESAGTGTISELLVEHPQLWRGAVMLSPVAFPNLEPEEKMSRSIFFSFGEEDNAQNQARMEKFIHEACGHLVRTQVKYGRSGHIFYDITELKKKYKAIATFILTDY
jgi:hypothetical protein